MKKGKGNIRLQNLEASELEQDQLPSSNKKLGSFSDRLRFLIGKQSVRSFAAACNLSDGVVRQYLAGKSEPGLTALVNIAAVANVSLDWLATGEGDMDSTPLGDEIKEARVRRGEAMKRLKDDKIVDDVFNEIFREDIHKSRRTSDEVSEKAHEPQPEYLIPVRSPADPELGEIVDILQHDLPEAKKFILKVLRGRKEVKEGLEGLGLKLKEEN